MAVRGRLHPEAIGHDSILDGVAPPTTTTTTTEEASPSHRPDNAMNDPDLCRDGGAIPTTTTMNRLVCAAPTSDRGWTLERDAAHGDRGDRGDQGDRGDRMTRRPLSTTTTCDHHIYRVADARTATTPMWSEHDDRTGTTVARPYDDGCWQ